MTNDERGVTTLLASFFGGLRHIRYFPDSVSLTETDKAMYSASMLDRTTTFLFWLFHGLVSTMSGRVTKAR